MDSTSVFLTVVIILFIYAGIGNVVGNRYFRRRHGVGGKLGRVRSWADMDAGIWEAAVVSMTWPMSMRRESVRNPELCRHGHHVLARAEARRRSGLIDESLDQERGS